MTPELDILLEDGPLIAVNKPAGLLTQGVPQGQVSLEAQVKQFLKQKYQKPGNVYLGVPHRLDRPTSGVVVFAKNSKAAARLAEQFRERTTTKRYLAIVERCPTEPSGLLVDWLLKDAEAAHVTVVAPETAGAKQASLGYRVLQTVGERALIDIELHTGRMHQIRVQLSARGWPILGDRQYGASRLFDETVPYDPTSSPIALHAHSLSLKHPVRYDDLRLVAPIPATWSALGFDLSLVKVEQK